MACRCDQDLHQASFGFEWLKRYLNVGQPGAAAGAYELT